MNKLELADLSLKDENERAPFHRRLEDILPILRCNLRDLRERYSVRSIEVFGSYVRGEQDEKSDLDILVEFDKVPGLFKYIELEDHLSDLVGLKVDLVMKRALKQNIGRQILSEAIAV